MPTSISSNDQIIINRILTAVAEYNASDLHLSVGNPPMLRVDNELTALREEQVVTPDFIEKFAQFFLSEDKKKTLVEEKEIVFSFDFQNRIRFKVHFFYHGIEHSQNFPFHHHPKHPTLDPAIFLSILVSLRSNYHVR